uniref:Uncharacterized protein n=1 Tax=Triticum urartu TaxID=4572 RepID=A0A8R7PK91_TRIUA
MGDVAVAAGVLSSPPTPPPPELGMVARAVERLVARNDALLLLDAQQGGGEGITGMAAFEGTGPPRDRRGAVPGAGAPVRGAGARVLRGGLRVRGPGRAPPPGRRRRVQERAPAAPRMPPRRLQGPGRLPPRQRLLRARGRSEQRGDEQAGAGAPRRARLRGHAQPPPLRPLPRAPPQAAGRRPPRHVHQAGSGALEGRRRRGGPRR